jgi:SOS response regulatory protein OraA/RecX
MAGEKDDKKLMEAKELLEKNAKKWAKLSGDRKLSAQFNFLALKGFSWEVIQKATGAK